MRYYEVIRDGHVIDAGFTFLKWQEKHRILIGCEPEEAQFIQSNDGNTVWRVNWLNPAPEEAGTYETVEACFIGETEYNDLRAVLDDGETPEQPEEEPEQPPEEEPAEEPETDPQTDQPMTVAQMREKITELEEMLNIIMGVVE